MGGNSSSRHVSVDDEEGVTFVKGIRLSERVIDRMKESPSVQTSTKSSTTNESLLPDELPHPPSYANTLVPPSHSEPPLIPVIEEASTPPPPVEPSEGPPTGDEHEPINDPVSTAPQLAEPLTPVLTSTTEPESITPPLITEPIIVPTELLVSTTADVPLETSPFPAGFPNPVPSASASVVVLRDEMPAEMQLDASGEHSVSSLHPVEEPVVSSFSDQVEVFASPTLVVDEEQLRKEIREDLQKQMIEEMKMAKRSIRQQLEEEKAKAQAQAQAAARLQIEEEVKKLLEEEKKSQQQTLADAIRREQLSVQDEHLITQYYWMERKAQKLKEKEKDLENQDALFRQQITKMKEKMSQFTKVTAENHKKGLEDAHNRFRRYQIKPVCSDLQNQILKCYAENKGRTMSCSNIASLYIQCVDRAKQDKRI